MQLFFSLAFAALLLPVPVRAQACFERGGRTAFLGAGFALTADVQRGANPGYNMDRGPAAFHALRLHWES